MKRSIFYLFSALLLLSSCADEETISINEENNPNLRANTKLANLMQRTSLKDGSEDNILDRSNCLTIELPVTVTVNGQELTINNEDDYDLVEDIFDASSDDTDTLVFQFPITIRLEDHSTVSVLNQEELNDYSDDCGEENEDDEDIECIDFNYPISASIFNSTTEQFENITLSNDQEMHDFIEELDEDESAILNFPITLTLFDGVEITVTNADELETIIENAEDICDEDDDFDFNDDDCLNCTTNQLEDILTNCNNWFIDKLEINDEDLEDNYTSFRFNFQSDGTVSVTSSSDSFEGTWSSSGAGTTIEVVISITGLPDLNANWTLHEIEDVPGEKKVDLRQANDDRLRFESNCN